MRHDQPGALAQEAADGPIDQPLGSLIDSGRGLVQDDQARVRQERPHQAEQLRLASRNSATSGADARLEPLRQSQRPFGNPELLQCGDDARVRDAIIEQRQVVAQGLAEEVRRGLVKYEIPGLTPPAEEPAAEKI